MSLLSVSSIQNPAAGQPNILLNADGSVTLPIVSGAAPAQTQAGTLWFDIAGPTLNIRNAANTAWLPVGGGGGGTVTGVTATAPLASTGGTAPVISATLATAAQAAAGTSNVVLSTPEFSVPKDASGMTGAAILPSGTSLQRPATPSVGMLRVNTDSNPDSVEAYDAAATKWRQLAYVPEITSTVDLVPANGTVLPAGGVYRSITINAGVTVTVPGVCVLTAKNITINGTVDGSGLGSSPGAQQSGSAFSPRNPGFGLAGTNGSAYGFQCLFGTGGGSGGFTVSGGTASGGQGGGAGAALVLKATESITVGATASILCNGQDATVGFAGGVSSACGGAGGGSGGLILLQSEGDITLTAGATLSVNGGDGSAATGVGAQSAAGGGGGGGGWIVLNAVGTLSNAATTSVTGGTGAAARNTSPATVDSGIGGSWGGNGGQIGFPVGANGASGQLITGAFI